MRIVRKMLSTRSAQTEKLLYPHHQTSCRSFSPGLFVICCSIHGWAKKREVERAAEYVLHCIGVIDISSPPLGSTLHQYLMGSFCLVHPGVTPNNNNGSSDWQGRKLVLCILGKCQPVKSLSQCQWCAFSSKEEIDAVNRVGQDYAWALGLKFTDLIIGLLDVRWKMWIGTLDNINSKKKLKNCYKENNKCLIILLVIHHYHNQPISYPTW